MSRVEHQVMFMCRRHVCHMLATCRKHVCILCLFLHPQRLFSKRHSQLRPILAKIAPERPLYGLWRPKCRHIASPQAWSIHVGGIPRDTGGAATPHSPCLAVSGRNLYPQPLLRHTQQGPLWPGVWVQGSVRTDHHCFRGLNPPNGGPYQVFLTIWHLSVCLRPPTLSERSGLLLS